MQLSHSSIQQHCLGKSSVYELRGMPTGIYNLLNKDHPRNIESPPGLPINGVSLRVAQKQMLCGLKGRINSIYTKEPKF